MQKSGRISRRFILLGSQYMLLYCILFLIDILFLNESFFDKSFLTTFNPTLTRSVLGNQGWPWEIFFGIVTGVISLYGYYDLKKNPQKYELYFIWGIFIIVLGVIGGTIGGIVLIFIGIFLLVNYLLIH